MTLQSTVRGELYDLLDLLLEEQIDDAGSQRLNDLLADSDEAQCIYLVELNRHAELAWHWGVLNDKAYGSADASLAADEEFGEDAEMPTLVDFRAPFIQLPFSHIRPSVPNLLSTTYHGTANFFSQEIPFACLMSTLIVGFALVIASLITKEHYTQMPGLAAASAERSYASGGAAAKSDEADKVRAAVKKHEEVFQFVGRVTGMVDCRWAEPGRTFSSITDYSVALHDKYSLISGLMEITYDTGAKVILQGPCTYEVDSAASGYLSVGKLTARVEKKGTGGAGRGTRDAVASGQWSVASESTGEAVDSGEWRVASESTESRNPEIPKSPNPSSPAPRPPPPSSLFAVRTPTAVVTDLGTEFGVEVDKSNVTLSHVYCGSVMMQLVSADGRAYGRKVVLGENESARVEKMTTGGNTAIVMRPGLVKTGTFVRGEDMPKFVEELRLKSFRRWEIFREALIKHDGLLAYYDFQRDPDTRPDEQGFEILPNRAKTGAQFDGKLLGSLHLGMARGRFLGKQALKFATFDDGVRVNIPGEFQQLTLAAWVEIFIPGNGLHALLLSDNNIADRPGAVHWMVNRGKLQIAFLDAEKNANDVFSDKPVFEEEVIPGWHHVAVVYDGRSGEVAHYFDGRRVGGFAIARPRPLSVGEAQLGNWNLHAVENRCMEGCLDEFAIFDRALSDPEIAALVQPFSGQDRKSDKPSK